MCNWSQPGWKGICVCGGAQGCPGTLVSPYFAQRLYDRLARPVHQIPRKDRYVCRADCKGCVYDKRAMRTVSKALGHNRLGVVTYYIR